MVDMRVFISSTYQDLTEYRKKTAEVIERLGQHGVRMEVFGARPENATYVCRSEIDESELFVGIYAHRYGFIPEDSQLSITEMEYRHALRRHMPMFCFFVDEDFPWRPAFVESEPGRTKLQAFKTQIGLEVVRDTFTTPEDLAFKVAASLGKYLITRIVKDELNRAAEQQPVGTEQSRDQVARRAQRLSSIVKGGNILLVDDSPSRLIYVSSILESLGVNLSTATETQEALTKLRTQPVDVVISDIRRGVVTDEGLKMLEQMRESGIRCPVIFYVAQLKPGVPAYAFGITNRVDELLNLTFDAFERVRG
jgi:CheY-like chemotaxis protein